MRVSSWDGLATLSKYCMYIYAWYLLITISLEFKVINKTFKFQWHVFTNSPVIFSWPIHKASEQKMTEESDEPCLWNLNVLSFTLNSWLACYYQDPLEIICFFGICACMILLTLSPTTFCPFTSTRLCSISSPFLCNNENILSWCACTYTYIQDKIE